MTDDEICRELFGPGVNSETCVLTVLDLLMRAHSDATFWRIFNLGWSCCDNTFHHCGKLLPLLTARGTAAPFLEGRDKDFYEGLPDSVRIYRGCSVERVRGLSWTIDRAVAAAFARGHRRINVPNPVVATAVIPREAIFTVATDREEQEVVIDWRRLQQVKLADSIRCELLRSRANVPSEDRDGPPP